MPTESKQNPEQKSSAPYADLIAKVRQCITDCDASLGPLDDYRIASKRLPRAQLATAVIDKIKAKFPDPDHYLAPEGKIRCSQCGVITDAACGCGVLYVGAGFRAVVNYMLATQPLKIEPSGNPASALDRAAAAIAADPSKSDRAIAAEIGVGNKTVSRARAAMKDGTADDTADDTPDRRVGRDGKSYPTAKVPPVSVPPPSDEYDPELFGGIHPDAITEDQRYVWATTALLGSIVVFPKFLTKEFGTAWHKLQQPDALIAEYDSAIEALQRIRGMIGK